MTPFEKVKKQIPYINNKIRIVAPIVLDDKVAVELGTWSGYEIISKSVYHVLAQNLLEILNKY